MLCIASLAVAALVWQDAIPIRQGVNIEWSRTGIETHDGAVIYAWSDTKLGERDLWAQKVDAQGNMVWGSPVLIDGKPDRQEDPVITRTSDNNYIIAWIDFYDDQDGNVYAQKINTNGELLWQEGGKPVCLVPGVQLTLNIEADNAGGAYIVWMDSRNPSKDLFGQRLDADGNPVWAVNGIAIADGIGDEVQNTMLPDGEGGLMIAYTHTYGNQNDVYVKRFLPNGTMAWPEKLPISTEGGNQSAVRMASIGNGDFILTWEDQVGADPDIAAQKMNISGQRGWPNKLIVYGDSGTPNFAPQDNPRIVGTSDNAAIIAWQDKRNDPLAADLYAQKVSSAGTLLWNADGLPLCLADFAQKNPRLSSDGAGGAYIVWDDYRNTNTTKEDIFAQHLSATGEALWGTDGKAICTAGNIQEGSLIKAAGNHVFVNWEDTRTGSVGIYYQVLNSAGDLLLEPDGQQVFWGLSGDAPLGEYLMLPRNDDIAIIWTDTRYANLGHQIFMQYVTPDGSIALDENGRSVTIPTGYDQLEPAAAVTPDGHILVLWQDKRHEYPKIYMQYLSPTGERLWEDTGIPLTDATPVDQKEVKVDYDAATNSFYIGWSNYDQIGNNFYYHAWGQRIHNGEKMWGPDGKRVSDLIEEDLNNQCELQQMHDGYYIWQRYIPMEGTQSIYAVRIDPSGEPADGWPAEGVKLSTQQDYDTNQVAPVSVTTEQGLFVMWRDQREDWVPNYFGQHVSGSGERLWDPLAVNLADYGREQEMATTLKNGPKDVITFAWGENIGGYLDIVAHRYSLDGTPMWNDLGYYVVQKDSTQSNPSMAAFPNKGMVVAWTEYMALESDIYYRYVNGDGSMVGSPEGEVVSDAGKSQYNPLIVTMGNDAYIIWADGRSSGKTEVLGLYMQKLSNETVGIDDPSIPPATGFYLNQNHPNPFNPHTNISFTIAEPSPAYLLEIYNVKGQKVRTLHKGPLSAGNHTIVWDGKDITGNEVASGMYFYRLSDGKNSQSRKMLLMK